MGTDEARDPAVPFRVFSSGELKIRLPAENTPEIHRMRASVYEMPFRNNAG